MNFDILRLKTWSNRRDVGLAMLVMLLVILTLLC